VRREEAFWLREWSVYQHLSELHLYVEGIWRRAHRNIVAKVLKLIESELEREVLLRRNGIYTWEGERIDIYSLSKDKIEVIKGLFSIYRKINKIFTLKKREKRLNSEFTLIIDSKLRIKRGERFINPEDPTSYECFYRHRKRIERELAKMLMETREKAEEAEEILKDFVMKHSERLCIWLLK